MAFVNFWDFVSKNPEEAIQVAAILGSFMVTSVVFSAGMAWKFSNSLTKSQLDTLDQRIKFAAEREQDLLKKLNDLQADIDKMPQTPVLDKKSKEIDFAKSELEFAKAGVTQAFALVEGTVDSVWSGVKRFISIKAGADNSAQ